MARTARRNENSYCKLIERPLTGSPGSCRHFFRISQNCSHQPINYPITKLPIYPMSHPRHPSHLIPIIPIWRRLQRFPYPRPSALISGKHLPFRCRAMSATSAITAILPYAPGFHPSSSQAIPTSSVPHPRRSSHVIPVIPIWRGLQRLASLVLANG